MLSKLSRFLTIATLTTVTCIITHPSNAKIIEIENSHPNNDNSLKVEKLIHHNHNNIHIQTYVSANKEVDHDGLLLYAIVADYYNKGQEKNRVIGN